MRKISRKIPCNIMYDIEKRTEITINFNNKLKKMCQQNNWKYVDNIDIALDKKTNIIIKELQQNQDYHYKGYQDKANRHYIQLHIEILH